MIIIEGADNSGKTTLSRVLGRMLNVPVLKNEQEKYEFSRGGYRTVSNGFGYTLMQFMITGDRYARDFIKDRDYPTELVYNRALGIEPRTAKLSEMDTVHAWMDTRIVYCVRRDYDASFTDELINIHQIARIKAEYFNFFNGFTSCKHMTVCLEDGTVEENALTVVKWLTSL